MKICKSISLALSVILFLFLPACSKTPPPESWYSETIITNNSHITSTQNDNPSSSHNNSSYNEHQTISSNNNSYFSSSTTVSGNTSSKFMGWDGTISHIISDASSSKPQSNPSSSQNKPSQATDKTEQYKKWNLTFEDNFDGNSLNMSKWSYCPEWVRDSCRWHRDAVSVKDGNLILWLNNSNEGMYHAGAIRTINTFKQAYGYYEVRCKAPKVYGVIGAFWLMGGSMNNKETIGGVDGAEIDILETHNITNKQFQHAVHWDGYGSDHGAVSHQVYKNIYDGEYHTFGFAWTKNEYIFYLDGQETWRTNAGGICQVPLYMKLTACTGGWVGVVDAKNVPTEAMIVDYVRVYSEPK